MTRHGIFKTFIIVLLLMSLAGCQSKILVLPSGSNLTSVVAQNYLNEITQQISVTEQGVVISNPKELAIRLDNARKIGSNKRLAILFETKKTKQQTAENSSLFIQALGALLAKQPIYKSGFFFYKIEHLQNDAHKTTTLLWDAAARVLGATPSDLAAEKLVDVAIMQFSRDEPYHYMAALESQKLRIKTRIELHTELATALVQQWKKHSKQGNSQYAKWLNGLNKAFLSVSDLNTLWHDLKQSEDESLLLDLASHRLAEASMLRQLDPVAIKHVLSMRQKIIDSSDSERRKNILAAYFPIAYFEDLVDKSQSMSELIIALRLMELHSDRVSAKDAGDLNNTIGLRDYQPFSVKQLGLVVPNGRLQLRSRIQRYLAQEPHNKREQSQWVFNTSLLMQGHPEELIFLVQAASTRTRPALMLATAKVLAQGWNQRLFDTFYSHIGAFKDSYSNPFYAQLMSLLSQGDVMQHPSRYLLLQAKLMSSNQRERALAIVQWTPTLLASNNKLDPTTVQTWVEATLRAGLKADESSLPRFVPQASIQWLLDKSVLAEPSVIPLYLAEQAIRERPSELTSLNIDAYLPKLMRTIQSAPDQQALPAARLAFLLTENREQARLEVSQLIRSKWL